ncbi:TraB/GumN family protein [Dyella telluris]|uniref:TraB/GumN family protein n=1 Tax=Dyella telluris TaxID=2763498 RepID=A0A7G8Q1R3_9GAMM|nr:TraB/GumN family protein [Dyella telluris]QNK00721.1 TraB/GumN family protein [Dyella telluris]
MPTLAPVVVTGVLPGPALWKVSKGSHVMWVLGLTSPVPKDMQWKSVDVERRIAASQALLKLPSLEVGVRTSFYRSSMMPSAWALGANPGGQSLRNVLAPDVYQHWLRLKAVYLGDHPGVERKRPILAGRELYEAALRQHGLVDETGLEDVVYKSAAHDGVATIDTSYQLLLKDPGNALHALSGKSMNDQRCLSQVLDALDGGLAQATLRANAWATGDIDALRGILSQVQEDACLSTLDNSPFAEALGINDIENRVRSSWVGHAEQALTRNQQTFAVLPMHELLAQDGYLSALKADGYAVQAPDL